ncbi:1-acyl-sn-glycerol-3-phosphate acyltransferase [Actinomadura barringtoniae]|uniref:1-acyl-sn-glycerol-3-phosphate acyltransferase n=1 Tax=Actinomadura barringtoniae TaxID=1427535 RepID=A0A939PEW0_9ACTN|nr:1-acyl-sn-glycerol-3-phosphate acyltransferase [Actinomadura barringtoniae]MBO2450947.1 1-acyl-sn-glycerol-3-phosphate acyltransferase [Actinomadura barringtoniae]
MKGRDSAGDLDRRRISNRVLGLPSVRADTTTLARRAGITETAARARLGRQLRGLVATRRAWAASALSLLLGPLHRSVWRLRIDEAGLERLRALGTRHPLVFLPAHRSYTDSPLLAAALRIAGVAEPFRLAGDNLSFWPIGWLARRSGTIYIRRDFGQDRSYQLAVRSYLAQLLRQGTSLEWYAEAGRSRTGRLRRPRHGLLRQLVQAFSESGIDDLYVVPVSITYEILPEAVLLAEEDCGGHKRPEGLAWLMAYRRTNQTARGTVARVTFGEPFSLREQAEAVSDQNGWGLVRSVAGELGVRLNEATPVTPESLLALLLSGGDHGPRTVAQICAALEPVLNFVGLRGIPLTDRSRLTGTREVRAVLDRLVGAGVLTSTTIGSPERRYVIEPEQHHLATFYAQSGAHWFVMRAIAELATILAPTPDEITASGRRLRTLLERAYVFPGPDRFDSDLAREVDDLTHPAGRHFVIAHRVLGPALEAVLRVAERLERTGPERKPDRRALTQALPTAQDGEPRRWPASASRDLVHAALAVAAGEGLLETGPGAQRARAAFAAELARHVSLLADVGVLGASPARMPIPEEERR